MTTLTARPFQGEADLQPLVALINACAAASALGDQGDEATSLAEQRYALSHPDLDTARDLQLWEDAAGLVAYAQARPHQGTHPDVRLSFKLRPDAYCSGIEDQVIAWAAERTRAAQREHGIAYLLASDAQAQDAARVALLARAGFQPIRHFLRLARPLDDTLPEPQIPRGYTLRQFSGDEDIEPWAELFNQSFVDHWNFQPLTPQQLRYYNSGPSYRADLDLIAIAPDGTFAAFSLATYSQSAKSSSPNEGYIDVLGTRRGYRKLGLGRAVLLASMRKQRDLGADQVALGVDAENPSGAARLYEAVGFRQARTQIIYARAVE